MDCEDGGTLEAKAITMPLDPSEFRASVEAAKKSGAIKAKEEGQNRGREVQRAKTMFRMLKVLNNALAMGPTKEDQCQPSTQD